MIAKTALGITLWAVPRFHRDDTESLLPSIPTAHRPVTWLVLPGETDFDAAEDEEGQFPASTVVVRTKMGR